MTNGDNARFSPPVKRLRLGPGAKLGAGEFIDEFANGHPTLRVGILRLVRRGDVVRIDAEEPASAPA